MTKAWYNRFEMWAGVTKWPYVALVGLIVAACLYPITGFCDSKKTKPYGILIRQYKGSAYLVFFDIRCQDKCVRRARAVVKDDIETRARRGTSSGFDQFKPLHNALDKIAKHIQDTGSQTIATRFFGALEFIVDAEQRHETGATYQKKARQYYLNLATSNDVIIRASAIQRLDDYPDDKEIRELVAKTMRQGLEKIFDPSCNDDCVKSQLTLFEKTTLFLAKNDPTLFEDDEVVHQRIAQLIEKMNPDVAPLNEEANEEDDEEDQEPDGQGEKDDDSSQAPSEKNSEYAFARVLEDLIMAENKFETGRRYMDLARPTLLKLALSKTIEVRMHAANALGFYLGDSEAFSKVITSARTALQDIIETSCIQHCPKNYRALYSWTAQAAARINPVLYGSYQPFQQELDEFVRKASSPDSYPREERTAYEKEEGKSWPEELDKRLAYILHNSILWELNFDAGRSHLNRGLPVFVRLAKSNSPSARELAVTALAWYTRNTEAQEMLTYSLMLDHSDFPFEEQLPVIVMASVGLSFSQFFGNSVYYVQRARDKWVPPLDDRIDGSEDSEKYRLAKFTLIHAADLHERTFAEIDEWQNRFALILKGPSVAEAVSAAIILGHFGDFKWHGNVVKAQSHWRDEDAFAHEIIAMAQNNMLLRQYEPGYVCPDPDFR